MSPQTITPKELPPLFLNQSTIIDVRTPAEFKSADVNGAQLHPLDTLIVVADFSRHHRACLGGRIRRLKSPLRFALLCRRGRLKAGLQPAQTSGGQDDPAAKPCARGVGRGWPFRRGLCLRGCCPMLAGLRDDRSSLRRRGYGFYRKSRASRA